MSKKKIIWGIFILFILVIVISFIAMSQKQKKTIDNYNFVKIDMNKVQEGTYIGEADSGMVVVKVEVIVEDHKIKDIIIIEHNNGLGSKAEKIIDDMIEKNTYEIESISGATASSITIKYAVNKALKKGII